MPEGQEKKLTYYVKSGNSYLTAFESDLPVMASSKELAREFHSIAEAQAAAKKLVELGWGASIEFNEELTLDENKRPRA